MYSAFVNMSSNKNVLGYTVKEQLNDLKPAFLLSLGMFAVTFLFSTMTMPSIVKLMIEGVCCVFFYFGVAKILRIEAYAYCVDLVKSLLSFKNK